MDGGLPPLRALRSVAGRRETWLLLLAGGLSASPVLVFAGLWGVPFLTQVHGFDRSQAAALTSTMLIAWAVFLFWGGILDGRWNGLLANGARVYDAAAYSAAFLWLFACSALSVAAVHFTRETGCRQSISWSA